VKGDSYASKGLGKAAALPDVRRKKQSPERFIHSGHGNDPKSYTTAKSRVIYLYYKFHFGGNSGDGNGPAWPPIPATIADARWANRDVSA
jgi:hypothetical protein